MPSLALACRLSAVSMALRRASSPPQFLPSSLFGPADQGYWYDNQDLTTMFQDTAGTVPVTAVEHPVGLQLDKSGKGNHRIAPGPTTSRPILRSRYNLLTYSEDFNTGAWVQNGTTVVGKKAIPSIVSGLHKIILSGGAISTVHGVTWRIRARAAGLNRFALWFDDVSIGCRFNLANGTAYSLTGSNVSASVTPDGDGWYICRVTTTGIAGVLGHPAIYLRSDSDALYFAGNGVDGIEFDKADVRFAADLNLPPYQRITTATDYDTVGFPLYLDTDGVDDWMRTAATVDFSGSDKVTLIQGLHKRSDDTGMVQELGTNWAADNNGFSLQAGGTSPFRYASGSRGTTTASNSQAAFSSVLAPDTAIISATHNISGDSSDMWRNNVIQTPGTADKGTGNFRNDYVYFYARGGSTFRFNGRDYGQFAISRLLSDTERNQVESWLNAAMGGIY